MATTRRVLGVDPGTLVTGYGIVDATGSRMQYVTAGVVRPERGASMPDRLATIFTELTAVVKEFRPDVLSVEEAFFGTNPKTAIKLGQARGAILVLGVLNGLEVVEFSPRLIKQSVVGTGGATKEQVQFMVTRILGLKKPPEPNDASDALACALCHILRPQVAEVEEKKLTKAQKQLKELGIL